jgi:outer membrane receptor protein involved in Fe transport
MIVGLRLTVVLGFFCVFALINFVHAEDAVELPTMEIINTTPLMGSGLEVDKIPGMVHIANDKDFATAQTQSTAELLELQFSGITVNNLQSNPYQKDIRYRGFTASPLLGNPQGLSVYVNGVRFNEPFGDTVLWDLLPDDAIKQMALLPGSNPIFGLNSLGGALSIRTKTGFTAPGHELEGNFGSWDRKNGRFSSGGNNGSFGYYVTGNYFMEDGYRDFSNSRVLQGLSTFSWQTDRSDLNLNIAYTDNKLHGNGPSPVQLAAINPKRVFTHPDRTINRLFLSSVDGLLWVTDDIKLSSVAYLRQSKTGSFNGDDSDFEECDDDQNQGFICEEDGDQEALLLDINEQPIIANDALIGATNNFSNTTQYGRGGSLQVSFLQPVFEMENQLIIGASYDNAKINYKADTELGTLTNTRATTRSGVLVDEARVRLRSRTGSYSFYLTDTVSVTNALALTFSARYNHTDIRLKDKDGTELNGRHTYDRFNPAGGFVYSFMPQLQFYGNYSESNRAPTPVELSCADPEEPCKLPNAFLSDPNLKQVVASTWEIGLRGRDVPLPKGQMNWNAGYFNTHTDDEIYFITSGRIASEGFFSNIGESRRHGMEAGIDTHFDQLINDIDRWHFSANYTYLDATFLDSFTAFSPNNPSADENGAIFVNNGSLIPGVPKHVFKFVAGIELWDRFHLSLNGVHNSDQVFRGDESNQNPKLGGYWLFNLRVELKVYDHVTLLGKIDNLFDRHYKTGGVYGQADEVLGNDFDDPRFVAPGSERAGWAGIRIRF